MPGLPKVTRPTEMASCCFLPLFIVMLALVWAHGEDFSKSATSSNIHKRMKREWIWNNMHIEEELNKTLPHIFGKIKSTIRNTNAMYVIEGEGAGSLFRVDDHTGDVAANERLDREKKAEYELTALILDRNTRQPLEKPAKFRVVVQDVNDNAPIFEQRVYNGSVKEMSPAGVPVTTVTAKDADDPTLTGHADVLYKVIKGDKYFSIDQSGKIHTAAADLDREQNATYTIVVEAMDGKGLRSEESGTATVLIRLIDINDNFPTFRRESFTFDVPENTRLNGEVGRLEVEDIDEPENRDTKYSFVHGSYHDTFKIEANRYTNEGIIRLKKPLDFEKVSSYKFVVEATDATIQYAHSKTKGSKSLTTVTIRVTDVDEPPAFLQASYALKVQEESDLKKTIGCVSAADPDKAKRTIKYSILRSNHFKISHTGCILPMKRLDREEISWHNITVAANELDRNTMVVVPNLETHVPVYIKVDDINDNAPEFAFPYDPTVCENAAPGKVIIRISAVDKDEMSPAVKFKYSLVSEDSNFTLIHNHDNTANVTVKYGQFNRELVKTHYLPIVISDNGSPQHSSTNTLSIRVCKCDEEGRFTFCEEAAKQVGVAIPALVVIFICILTFIVIILFIAWRKRQKKDLHILKKNVEEIHEQLVAYDEEGGGEMDTTSYDVSVLIRQRGMTSPRMTRETMPCAYSQVQKPPGNGLSGTGEMGIMIELKKDEADNDGDLLPYDTLHIYGYEGAESIAESLSSLGSGSSDSDIDYDFLNDWGPRFKMLAELYGLEPNEDLVY